MKYCKSCKKLYPDSAERCGDCNKRLTRVADINEPVRLCVVGGTERAMLTGMLHDAEIPFVEQNVMPQGVANEIVTGYDVKLNNIAVLVPYSAIPKARELMLTIDGLRDENEALCDDILNDIEKYKNNSFGEEKPMSPALRTTIKVITAILLLVLIGVVVLGTDKIMELIKGLFGG